VWEGVFVLTNDAESCAKVRKVEPYEAGQQGLNGIHVSYHIDRGYGDRRTPIGGGLKPDRTKMNVLKNTLRRGGSYEKNGFELLC